MTATINGYPILTADVLLSTSGVWTAQIEPHNDAEIANGERAEIQIGNLALFGTIVFGSMGIADSSFFVVGGYGGWRKPVDPRAYQDDAGVRLSDVLQDLATETGERVQLVAADRRLGASWVRLASSGAEALTAIGLPWRVLPDGTTEVGPRASSSAPSAILSMAEHVASLGRVVIDFAEDEVAAVAPGVTIDLGEVVLAAREARVLVSPGTIRAEVLP